MSACMLTDQQCPSCQQAMGVCRMKKDTHPDFYEDAKVGHAAALCFCSSHPTFPSSHWPEQPRIGSPCERHM